MLSAIGAAVARFPDTEEVTGSIPVSRTSMESSDVKSGDFLCTRGRTSDLLGLTPSARERFIGASRARKILPLAGSNPVSSTSMESSDGKSGDFLCTRGRTSDFLGLMPSLRERKGAHGAPTKPAHYTLNNLRRCGQKLISYGPRIRHYCPRQQRTAIGVRGQSIVTVCH